MAPSPRKSLTTLSFDAPSAFFKPISFLRSVTTAIIVVDTQIIIMQSTMTVTIQTKACNFLRTVSWEAVTRFTACGSRLESATAIFCTS